MTPPLLLNKVETIANSGVPALTADSVHLWFIPLNIDENIKEAFLPSLSDRQLSKLARLPSDEKQRRYIAGRGYLYQLLQYYSAAEADISLKFGQYGKPSLINNPLNIRFNVTDTCGYGLFAFTLENDLGVDIESLGRTGKFKRIIERRYSPEEQLVIHPENTEQFLRCWVRKEAYGKALGCGLNYPLREHVMCVNIDDDEFESPDKKWFGQQFKIEYQAEKFIACLFSSSQNSQVKHCFSLTA